MKGTIAEKILKAHIVEGELVIGQEIGIRIDQTLTQDATGTMVYLEFESMGLKRIKNELAVSYIDHNVIQTDYRNADDHRFLQSAARKYGVILSPAGERRLPPHPPPALRRPGQDPARLGQPHDDRRLPGHARDGRRRHQRGHGDGRPALLHQRAGDLEHQGRGRLPALRLGQGPHPEPPRPVHLRGGHRQDHGVRRPRAAPTWTWRRGRPWPICRWTWASPPASSRPTT